MRYTNDRRKKKKLQTTLQLMDIKEIDQSSVITPDGQRISFILITPVNMSVLSDEVVAGRISALANILTSIENLQILCLNASQSYEKNKEHLAAQMKTETNEVLAELDRKDIEYLDDIRISMATGREFAFAVRFKKNIGRPQQEQTLKRLLLILLEAGFTARIAEEQELKGILAIYFAQDIYNDYWPDFDGEEILSPAEAKQEKSFLELIAPSIIDFRRQRYYVCGNTQRTVWAVRGYPTTTKDQTIFRELGEKDGVTLHIYTRPVGSYETNKILERAERRNRHMLNNSSRIKEKVEAESNMQDVQLLIENMHRSKEPFLHCAVFIEMAAGNDKALELLQGDVAAILNRHKILYDKLFLQQKEGMISAMPTGQNLFENQFERVLPASSVANMFPFSYSGKTDPQGMYIGRDANGSNIIVNFDQRGQDKTNGHIIILGNSGEGKSFLLKILSCIFRQSRKNLYILDPENEYKELTEALGGTYMDMMTGKYIINPLEPRLWNQEPATEFEPIDTPKAFLKPLRINQHIAFLRDFFSAYKPFPTEQLDTLEIMLELLYKEFHITEETDYSRLRPSDYPILTDLYKLMTRELENYEEKAATGLIVYRKETLRELCLGLHGICTGAESVYFNGYTNIPNAKHIDFGVKDMLSTNQSLSNAMYFNILSFMSHKFLTDGDTNICCDELHELLKNRIAISYLLSFIKRGRKRGSNVILASQNVSDFFLPEIVEYTKPLLSIPTHRFLFYPGSCDTEEYKRILGVSDSEYRVIQNPNRGHCLYSCGNERYHLHVIAPKYKKALFGTAGGA